MSELEYVATLLTALLCHSKNASFLKSDTVRLYCSRDFKNLGGKSLIRMPIRPPKHNKMNWSNLVKSEADFSRFDTSFQSTLIYVVFSQ